MSFEKKIEAEVDKILKTNTVSGAKKIFKSKSGLMSLSAISFVESGLPGPILTDPFLIAAILIDRARALKLVVVTTLASALGGAFAYLTAAYFFDYLVKWLSPENLAIFESIIASSGTNSFMIGLIGAVTPVPYTASAWAAGAIDGSLLMFILASIIGRGFRYGVVGYATYKFGPAAYTYAKKYIGITSVVLLALVAIYIFIKVI
jgi:membrane protein YqaA with SNARE-associated domain